LKRVFVAGKITADTPDGTFANIRAGLEACNRLMEMGLAPFPVFCDFAYLVNGHVPVYNLQEVSLTWLEVADAVLMLPDWESSKGARRERMRAQTMCLPIFYNTKDLLEWAQK
jgi:hypothetical protein